MRARAEIARSSVASLAVTVAPSRKVGGGSFKSNTDALRTRHRIGLRRNLANLAFNVNAGKNLQADRKGQADPQRDRKVRPDIDDSLSDVRPRDGNDGLTG